MTPVGGAAEEGDPLAGDLVDDHELRVVAAGFAGDDGGGGDAEDEREGDAGEQGEEQRLRSGMQAPGEGGPEEDGGDRAPSAGAGLAEACAEEGGDRPCPGGFRLQRGCAVGALFIIRARCSRPPPSPPRSSRTSGSRMGELIL